MADRIPSPPSSPPSSTPPQDNPRAMDVAPEPRGDDFDIVATYQRLLREDRDLTMPVAAIEALVELLIHSHASTISETLDLLETSTAHLKSCVPNPISLSAGTDLFQRYLIASLQRPGGGGHGPGTAGDFQSIRAHLISNGRLFVTRAKASRAKIAGYGRHFVRDGTTVLTNGGSRVVGALLARAADDSHGGVRFRVIHVRSSSQASWEGADNIFALRSRGIPVASIPEGAVAYSLGKVSMVIVGAEGVVENGGIISRLGTYQMGLLAKAAGKPFYVVAESHKFVRLYPLSQYDLPIEQRVIDFRTEEDGSSPKEDTEKGADAVDFTPPDLISALITEAGVLTPSAVSEELIKIWF
ncbi:MAG: translation initiation factor eIF-2B subunit alpha [Thelocarpon impressellum]|nr:MAG: translation initiation factor eIF-2B subunit alpha [Thelocarpon impressellum]